jgi:ABC-type Zn uptake system ZnuABC Zn-binding protein ZnuA
MPRLPTGALLLAAAGALASGCGGGAGAGSGELQVVATTTQVADLARSVARERAEVRSLLKPGSDPHGYEPRPSDVRALAEAKLVVRSGGEVDEWLTDVLEGAGGEARELDLIEELPGGEGPRDPHWWQDPRSAMAAVAAIRDKLSEVDPDGRAAYGRNARAYVRKLRRLDRRVARCIDRVPAARRKFVTSHDALGPFAARYGLKVVGALIPSRSTQAQPSLRDTERLVEQIRAQGVAAIFPESALAPRLERAVSRQAGAKVGEPLWVDSLGPPGSSGATYLGAMAANARALVKGMSAGRSSCDPSV